MIVTHKIPYRDGELRIGWASWDDGSMTERSIKYAYKDASGKVSRGAPELPFDILVDMVDLAFKQGEVSFGGGSRDVLPVTSMSRKDLVAENEKLKSALMMLQKLTADLPWAGVAALYDQIGARYEDVKLALTGHSRA